MKEDISTIYKGYIVRHVFKDCLGLSMREIIIKAMTEVEKCREICGSVMVPPYWIPIIRKWDTHFFDVDFRTGYVGTLYGADFYIDTGIAPDEMVIKVYGDTDRIFHIFRLVLNVI
jgi:hypothetical protein